MSDSENPWTVACQTPLPRGFSRQEYWSGMPFPSPGDLPGIEPGSPALQADFFLLSEPHCLPKPPGSNMIRLGIWPSACTFGRHTFSAKQTMILPSQALKELTWQNWLKWIEVREDIRDKNIRILNRKWRLCSIFSSVQLLSRVWLFVTPWIAACQASLSITNSWSSLRFTSTESVMPSSHLILCRPLLLLPLIPPSIRVFSNESTLRTRWPKY